MQEDLRKIFLTLLVCLAASHGGTGQPEAQLENFYLICEHFLTNLGEILDQAY